MHQPENILPPFEVCQDPISDILGTGFKRFRVGTCHGLWRDKDNAYEILAIANEEPHNGHFGATMHWFETSAKRDGYTVRVLEIMNASLARTLKRRGYSIVDANTMAKDFRILARKTPVALLSAYAVTSAAAALDTRA